jgi:cytochrome c biogenesis protein CcdA
MATRTSGGLITFGVINIIIALAPMCAGCTGIVVTAGDPKLNLNGRELGPEFKQHIDRNVPGATVEAFAAAALGCLFSALLIAGAIGLFLTQSWARWLTIGASVFLILTMCIHDIYQLAVFRPAVMDFLDRNLGVMRPEERVGFKFGFTASFFFWSCSNPVIMIYLFAMSLFLSFTGAFKDYPEDDDPPVRRRRPRPPRDDYDDDVDDRDRRRPRRSRYDDDDDDRRFRE